MTKAEAMEQLRYGGHVEGSDEFMKAYWAAVDALELIGHLNNRPCEACEFRKPEGCCKWDCVFDKHIEGR